MSGGFFRGTSADQDTRFSNKQAKLLKSQKFAPELENLVDMTKVKMDVMRPWIARRVTELIGFEDEVLINFIYGLLEGKQVDGKQVQISLTGFMERNTGKFMKELWVLLLSAQQNVSGVPQQFLDAKEVETKKKKAETDRIAADILRKKEKDKQEAEQEKTKMDGDGAMSRERHADLELSIRRGSGRSSIQPEDDGEQYKRNGLNIHNRGSQSQDSFHHSPSPSGRKRSISPMKSSHSRSRSNERQRSRSLHGAPPSRSRSISLERRCGPSPKRSLTPRRRHIIHRTPSPRRRSSYYCSRRRSPSPSRYRVRSPLHHRSRSPIRRRSRSPVWRRSRTPRKSLVRYRSKTPLRGSSSSPLRHRTPSPMQGRKSPSFIHRRSPSPLRRRLPSAVRRHSRSPCHEPSPSIRRYRRSPSTPQQRSISPVRRRSSMHGRKRSITPVRQRFSSRESSSPSHIGCSSLSLIRRASLKGAKSLIQPPGERARRHEKYSLACRASPNERAELPAEERNTRFGESKPVLTLRSPQRDMLDQNNLPRKDLVTHSMRKSPFDSRDRSDIEEQRSTSPHGSPYQRRGNMTLPVSPNTARKAAGHKPRHDSSGTSADDDSKFSRRSSRKVSPTPVYHKDLHESAEVHGLADGKKSRNTQLPNSDGKPEMSDHDVHRAKMSTTSKTSGLSVEGRKSYNAEGTRVKDKKIARADDSKGGYRSPELEALPKLSMKSEQNDQNGSFNLPSKETDEHKVKSKEKRKHKLDRQEVDSDDHSSYDSYEERKEAKRRRKEEKKLKREERRRRREERHRRRDGRCVEKLKFKSSDAGSSSSDLERVHSEHESIPRRDLQASTTQGMDSDQRRLERELREKALESLRAKKGFAN